MAKTDLSQHVQAVRRFNRFYTKQIGVLNAGFLSSPFSLSEVRVMYELAHRATATATELSRELGMDAGQLSRILHKFLKQGLVSRQQSEADGRQNHLFLTKQGREAFAVLDERQANQIEELLAPLSPADQERAVKAMEAIQELFSPPARETLTYTLRSHQPGDMGWVVQAHGAMYAEEYQWDEQFEGLVASIVSDFLKNCDPRRERCWIAERDGENVGSIFLVKHSDTVAKLRLFLVDPKVRGIGIGSRLVEECIRFARQAGYRKITLWTNDVLLAARRIYERAGFRLVDSEPHHSFGHDLIGETWELEL